MLIAHCWELELRGIITFLFMKKKQKSDVRGVGFYTR